MTSVAIIGAGQTGASAALTLAKQGVEVTLYSDRLPPSDAPPVRDTARDGLGQPATRRGAERRLDPQRVDQGAAFHRGAAYMVPHRR
jgi:2-polyprenyl-6-methoxyphenol hydroxylase-like FAD-dependent oxidoreductase